MNEPPEGFESSYKEESLVSTILRTCKEKPVGIIGVTGMFGICGYGYWRYKNKGVLVSTSLFLMQLRVAAQAAVVGCLTIAMTYNMFQELYNKKKPENTKSKES